MTPLAFSGASVDGGLYLRITESARHTPAPVNRAVEAWTTYGLIAFAALMLAAWWTARGRDAGRLALAVCAPVVVGLVFLLDTAVKSAFAERRPCGTLSGAFTVESCPGAGDWSFPSNHAVIAASAATMVWLVHRALGIVAAVAAVAMAASRVWVGVHYPHDVAAGLVFGFLMTWPLAQAAVRAAPWVERLRASRRRVHVAR